MCIDSVTSALSKGVKLIDTDHASKNEKKIGEAIRNSTIPRKGIFVVSKIYPNLFESQESAINETLENLDIGYMDLMLLHHPGNIALKFTCKEIFETQIILF